MDELDIFSAIRSKQTPPVASRADELTARLVQVTGESDWRELVARGDTPELQNFLRREFPREATLYDTTLNRRAFLQLVGAAVTMAGLAACAPPQGEKIVPYVNQPERILPGLPLYYTTAMTLGGYATGLLVRSETGRPIKVEGNPNHPASFGATDIFAQASILSLYDPDRSRSVMQKGQPSRWNDLITALQNALNAARGDGAGLRVLTQTISSPTLAAQLQTFLSQFPNARWHQYEPFNRDNTRAGAQLAFGQYVETRYDLTRADVILALDSDFLNCRNGGLRYARDFSARRQVNGVNSTLNRLYAVESTPTLTGAQADHRLAVRASQIAGIAQAVAAAIGVTGVPAAQPANLPANWLNALARDLQAHRGTSVVIVGDGQPPYVHALAHAMNNALGNVGATVIYTDPTESNPTDQLTSLRELVNDMDAGRVQSVLILEGNPVFDAPADFQFGERLKKVRFSAHLSLYQDETSAACTWHIPATHYLEMWGDARAFDGTVSIVQPLIAPLYGGKSAHELLSVILDSTPRAGSEIVKANWQGQLSGNFDSAWRETLSTGVMANTAFAPRPVTLKTDWIGNAPQELPLQSYEVVFAPDPTMYDGRFANNAWLQELPKPFSKLTWDNVIAVSPATAQRLGLATTIDATGGEHGQVAADVVQVSYQGQTLRAPVWILLGHPDDMVTLNAGYGRSKAGSVGTNVGFNPYALRTSNAFWFGAGLEMTKLNERVSLATTQFHSNMEGRDLVQHATLQEFVKNPNFAQHRQDNVSLYPPPNMQGEQWGMAIDLNACIGCNACVVACQAENNIPSVGKDEVLRAREMHWLRIDRYEQGEGANLQTYFEPIPCMHCEYAPCELVCPVAATTHSPDGLNEMTYNRCIGTRYCSNNCPYKVRRFNFFQYQDWDTSNKTAVSAVLVNATTPLKGAAIAAMHNPDVTVRSRGVMEKCTYCVQRINRARIAAEKENRAIRDGEILTACQAACPTEAIIFGNINDPNSRVAQLKANPRNYALLDELNTRPRTTYLAVVRNPNPEIT